MEMLLSSGLMPIAKPFADFIMIQRRNSSKGVGTTLKSVKTDGQPIQTTRPIELATTDDVQPTAQPMNRPEMIFSFQNRSQIGRGYAIDVIDSFFRGRGAMSKIPIVAFCHRAAGYENINTDYFG
jgi:hypothetical protein